MSSTAQPARLGAWVDAIDPGALSPGELHALVSSLARAHQLGPLALHQHAMLLRDAALTRLDHQQATPAAPRHLPTSTASSGAAQPPGPEQTRDLQLVVGWLSTLLARWATELGRDASAAAHARTAWLYAEATGQDELRAWSRAAMAAAAHWRDDVLAAARLAEEGLRHARAGTVGVLLAGMAAANWARLGRQAAADTALAVAREASAHSTPDEIGGVLSCPPERQHGYAGSVHLWLGRPEEALLDFDAALDLFGDQPAAGRIVSTEALVRVDTARTHLQLGELAVAEETLEPVLGLPMELRTAPICRRLALLAGQLAAPRFAATTSARDLQDSIERLRAHSVSRTLPH